MKAIALVAVLASCTTAGRDRATLALSTALLAADWNQTRSQAEVGWSSTREANPLLGTAPDVHAVDSYFAIAALANVALWIALPPRWRSAIPVGVMAIEARIAIVNAPVTGWMP